jgi:hypothetical protein
MNFGDQDRKFNEICEIYLVVIILTINFIVLFSCLEASETL